MRSEYYLDVRYYETDQMGIVHHSNYIRYFECGRSDFLKKAGLPLEKIEAAGIMMPVVSVECKYKTPAVLGDTLKVVTSIDSIPQAKLCVHQEIYNSSDALVCTGSVVLGFIDAKNRRPVRCPKFICDFFEGQI